jgi:hypothetical protein
MPRECLDALFNVGGLALLGKSAKIFRMSYKMGWIKTVSFQVLDGNKELVFHLADGLSVPPEFKEGDDINVNLRPDHPENIAMGMKSGYYKVTHLQSGKTFEVPHKTGEWRLPK